MRINIRLLVTLLCCLCSTVIYAQQRGRYEMKDYQFTVPFAEGSAVVDTTDSVVVVRLEWLKKAISRSYDSDQSVIYGMTVRGLAPVKELADERALNMKTWIRLRYPSPVKLQALQTMGEVKEQNAVTVVFTVMTMAAPPAQEQKE